MQDDLITHSGVITGKKTFDDKVKESDYNLIHPSAVIDDNATIGKNVKIGPFCTVGKDVILGDNVELKSHVVVTGRTTIGANTVIYPFASIGQVPQILKFGGEDSEVIIGSNNNIREYVTIQAGTLEGGMVTKIGDNCLFMVGVHIGHDCIIGNNVVFANYVSLGGHVRVGDHVVIGGLAAVQQFVSIGRQAMIGGFSGVDKNVIPFGFALNERASLEGLNLIGMNRRGFNKNDTREAMQAFNELFSNGDNFIDKTEKIAAKYAHNSVVQEIATFLRETKTGAFCLPKDNS